MNKLIKAKGDENYSMTQIAELSLGGLKKLVYYLREDGAKVSVLFDGPISFSHQIEK